jgi:hypothetical protein
MITFRKYFEQRKLQEVRYVKPSLEPLEPRNVYNASNPQAAIAGAMSHPMGDFTQTPALMRQTGQGANMMQQYHPLAQVGEPHAEPHEEEAPGGEQLVRMAEEELRRRLEIGEVEVRELGREEFHVEMPELEDGAEIQRQREEKVKEEIKAAFEGITHKSAEVEKEGQGLFVVRLVSLSAKDAAFASLYSNEGKMMDRFLKQWTESADYKENKRKRRLS